MSDICNRCGKDLLEVTEDAPCMECTFVYDPLEPLPMEELNFNTERERVYEKDISEELDYDD